MPLSHPLIVPAIRLDQDAEAETRKALERAREPWVAGFILFGGRAEQVARLTADLRDAAGRSIFLASDMERGAGQQVKGLTRLPDFGILGLAATPWEAACHAELTAREAMSVGIDVVFGPCLDVRSELDNPILGNRSFGFDPQRVCDLGSAYVSGVLRGGALPVAKHFPGHGATREDSHDTTPVVEADLATLSMRDLPPFARALGSAGCPAVMAAHVTYPALDPSDSIATFSAPILERARALAASGPDGGVLVFTDALMMAGAMVAGGEPDAAVRALGAGCDMLLYPDEPEMVAATVVDDECSERAAANRKRFLERAAEQAARAGSPTAPLLRSVEACAARATRMACDTLTPADILVLVDDDAMERRGTVLAAAAQEHGVPVVWLRAGESEVLDVPHVDLPGDEDAGVVVVVFAQARAWKGASGASEACRVLVERLREELARRDDVVDVIWCAPRCGPAGDVHMPGNGPQVEQALAERIFPGPGEPSPGRRVHA